jgi:thiamine biosynthesis lipoprotein
VPARPTSRLALLVPLLVGGLLPSPCIASPDSLYHEARAAFEEIARVEAALSSYRPTSEISRINGSAVRGPVVTDPEVFGVIEQALHYSRRSDGAFDITVGALMRAWGFFRDDGHYPSLDELAEARAKVGWQHVALDNAKRSIRFLTPGIELDLGGIGKGFALDRAAHTLRRHGVTAALLGAGQSSYYAIGAPPDTEGWAITVHDPDDPARALSTVPLRDRSLSTSGNDQKSFWLDGRKYSHIIDPRTGEPATGMMQVTVTARTAADSDALATALFVLGPERAADLIEQGDDVAALLVTGHETEDHVVAIEWVESLAPGAEEHRGSCTRGRLDDEEKSVRRRVGGRRRQLPDRYRRVR